MVSAAFIEPTLAPASSNQDFSQNIIGANSANNDFSSTLVAGNANGSLIERVEYIITAIAALWTKSGDDLYYTTGNVGIGSDTTPDYKLDVQGTFRADSTGSFGGALTASNLSGTNTGDNTVATSGDSATSFFSTGTIEDARLPATISSNISGSAVSFTGSLAGDVTGTQGVTVVGNDSHTHTASTISGLGVVDFSSANISQWTNDSGYTTNTGDITGITNGTGISGGCTSGTCTLSATLGTAIEKGEISNSGTLSFDWADSEVSNTLTSSSCTGNAATATNADKIDDYHLSQIWPYHSGSDFASGTLVTTSIPATADSGASFVIEISGKSYDGSNPPFLVIAQGYLYASTIVSYSGISYGGTFPTYIKMFENGGYLSFWWPRYSYWNSFSVKVRDAGGSSINTVTSIVNSTEPTGTKKVTCTLAISLTSSNYTSYTVPKTGGTFSGSLIATSFLYSSDRRLKEKILPVNNALSKIQKLEGVSFKWKDEEKGKGINLGLIAQDVEKVFPELVSTDKTTGLKSVQYGNLVSPIIEAVKEQQKEIDELRGENDELRARIEALEN